MTTSPIVAATDGSAESIQAVEWAAREAALHHVRLRIVSAAELLPRMTPPPRAADFEVVSDAVRHTRDHALAAAAKAAAAIAPDVEIDTEPLEGPPAEAVTNSGDSALMLVLGSRGASAFTAMVLGSVSRYAAIHASSPVVVVREETMAAHRQVIVGIRDPQDCAAALAFAFSEAQLRNAALVAVHAWQSSRSVSSDMPPAPGPAAVERQMTAALDQLLNQWQGKYPGVVASHDVVHGHPGRVLAGLSARADLVVLGRHERHRQGLPGPARIAHAVLGHAHGPVATVPSAT